MGLFELAVFISAIVALYNFQQIKIILKEKGYTVDMMSGWLRDYREFKALMLNEPDESLQLKYRRILNGLHFSIAGLIFFTVMILRNRL